ncbi:MAG: IS21 family transposase [Actinomycetota bacterium]|nr:IS21 family transposase [Actinomycetota bacterium]
MDQWTEIRRKVLVEGASKRSVCRDYGLGWWTLKKILDHPEPPGYRSTAGRAKPKLGEFLCVIDEILEADKSAPPKQRHTARRIFERLRDEYGYTGGITQVKDAVRRARRYSKEVFVPLSHPPGHAQFDFGEATVIIAGELTKAHLAVITLPYSDCYFVSAYPRECTETFHAGHTAGFEFFGGVPVRISYDNTSIAVKKIVGRERELTTEFLRLQSHHLFAHHFCRVGRGNEKGHVENHVGYSRRNLLVPVPSFPSWAALNEYLAACCFADLNRSVWGKVGTKADRLEEDRAAMLALPTESFESRRVAQAQVNSLSLVRFDRNDYSVPTEFAHHRVTCLGGVDTVTILSGTEVVATHPRNWAREQVSFDPCHYLALLERKPGALDFARPLEGLHLPGCFAVLRRRLEADLGHGGTREYIKVLRLMERATLGALSEATEQALAIGSTGADAIACILQAHTERPVGLFSLDGHPHLKEVSVEPPDLTAYRALTANG